MFVFRNKEKLYKRFFVGGKQRSHTHTLVNKNNNMFVSNRAPLNYGCGFVWFLYTKTDQVNVSIYIEECKGVPSTHQTGTVTVVNLKKGKRETYGY